MSLIAKWRATGAWGSVEDVRVEGCTSLQVRPSGSIEAVQR